MSIGQVLQIILFLLKPTKLWLYAGQPSAPACDSSSFLLHEFYFGPPTLLSPPSSAIHARNLMPSPPPSPSVPQQVRSGTSTNSFMMVDSPGMIDSPMSRSIYDRSGPGDSTSTGPRRGADTSRGYDFEGVVRWFAERADVILLFFDPDKPGTTGETLSILTNSLPGMDHKLYIVLNKVCVCVCVSTALPTPLPQGICSRVLSIAPHSRQANAVSICFIEFRV